MTTLLKVEHMSAGYRGNTVVRDVSFSVGEGEVAGILGENGCGKTTLFKSIFEMGTRLSGTAFVNGRDTAAMTVKERSLCLALLPSGGTIPSGLLADEVLEMGWYARLRFLQSPDKRLRREKEQVIQELGLESYILSCFDQLSQGQKQMILLGRMLLQDAPVFLMDEPDTSLDFKHKHGLLQRIRSMAGERKKAGLMILHDPSLALTYCDKVFLMKDGRLLGTICPQKDTEEQIAEKIKPITGTVMVTKLETSVIISP